MQISEQMTGVREIFKESVVLAGVKRPEQLLGNVEAFGWNLTEKELKILDEVSK